MAETHGFTIRINGDDGKPMTVVFASTRKCPALLGILKSIRSAQKKYDRLVLDRGIWRSRIQSLANADTSVTKDATGADIVGGDPYANEESFAALQASVAAAATQFEAISDATDDVNTELCDLTYQFFLAGFKGAGYNEDLAEKYAAACDPADLPALRDRTMTGCGVVDFTKRDTI
jgi:hypothetical protein